LDRLEVIKNIVILSVFLFIEYAFLSPNVQYFIELGLNIETTVGGVTAPTHEFMSPTILYLLESMWLIIDIFGTAGTISIFFYYIKKLK